LPDGQSFFASHFVQLILYRLPKNWTIFQMIAHEACAIINNYLTNSSTYTENIFYLLSCKPLDKTSYLFFQP
jgi:hypothetical protein